MSKKIELISMQAAAALATSAAQLWDCTINLC